MKVDVIFKDTTVAEAKKLIACAEQLELFVVNNKNEPVPTETVTIVDETEDVEDIDADGLPWDARIHSSSKKKNADGRWARRRNVLDEYYNKIKNELLGVEEPVAPVEAPAPIPAPAPVATLPIPPVNPAAAVAPVTPTEILGRIQKGVIGKILNVNDVQNCLESLKLMGIPVNNLTEGLNNDERVVKAFDDLLKSKGL